MSAAGNYVPVMFVFPRKRETPALLDDTPPGSFDFYHESGWINKESFLVWFSHFIEFSNPTPEKPVLLILDGHNSHTKSIELINLAREKNVIFLCFPPHTTHRLQPLDVTFMAPLSTYYEQEVRRWLVIHPGRVVTIVQVGKLFNAAFQRAASVQTAVKGFEKTGIYPFNRNIFLDHLFAPAETTERPLVPTEPQLPGSAPTAPTPQQSTTEARTSSDQSSISRPQQRTSSTVSGPLSAVQPLQTVRSSTSAFTVSPSLLMSPPQETERIKKKSNDKRRGKTVILTSSPYKKELQDEEEERKKRISQRRSCLKNLIVKLNQTKTQLRIKLITKIRRKQNSSKQRELKWKRKQSRLLFLHLNN